MVDAGACNCLAFTCAAPLVASYHKGRDLNENTSSKSSATDPASIGSVPRRFLNHFIHSGEAGAGEQIFGPLGFGLPLLSQSASFENEGNKNESIPCLATFHWAVLWQLIHEELGALDSTLPFTKISLRAPSF